MEDKSSVATCFVLGYILQNWEFLSYEPKKEKRDILL